MTHETYMKKRNTFLTQWKEIKALNDAGDYSCGTAIDFPMQGKTILFDGVKDRTKFFSVYGH